MVASLATIDAVPFGPRGIYRLIPSLTWQAREQVAAVLARAPTGARIVDLGAGGRKISPSTITVDFVPTDSTDVIADVQRLPFRDASVDLIYATGLFEHVADDRAVIEEMARIIRPGGRVHIEVPFLEQYHEDPIDCRRFTVEGLEREMARVGFRTELKGAHIGPTVALLNLTARWCALWLEGRGRVARVASFGVFSALSFVFWPFRFIDAILIRKPGAAHLAMGVFYTGIRRHE